MRTEFVVASGSLAETIVKAAAERQADLIVLGVRSAGVFPQVASHLPGPEAFKVVAQAPCPVLTVRGGEE